MRIALLAILLSGCGYAGALRVKAVDAIDQRAERTLEATRTVALTLLAGDATELPDPDEEVKLIDVSALDPEDVEHLVRQIYRVAADASAAAERSRAWLACLRSDLGAADAAEREPLNSDAEHAVYVQYAGVSGARAWHLKQWRSAMKLIRGVRRFARRTYAVARWCLYGAVAALSSFGLWQWRKQRRETKAAREGVDAIASMRSGSGHVEATAGKPALKGEYERKRRRGK